MPEAGSATDINFTVKKAGTYEISFHLRTRSAKAGRGRKTQRRGLSRIRQRCVHEVVLPEDSANTTQGVPEPIGTSEEEKAACTGKKILLKVALKSMQNRKISYVKGGEMNELKQNLSAVTETFDLSKYGATSWYSAPNGGFAHDKVLLRAELEKGEYSVKVQALGDVPELKKIVTFIKISKYHNWK